MKRILSILFSAMLILSGCSADKSPAEPSAAPTPKPEKSSYSVPDPMPTPVYTFEQTPTTDQLRKTAIAGMRDLLSIQWHTATEIAYTKTGPMSQKQFKHLPNNVYAGTLYSNASTGIFQFLEFYDLETGELSYPGEAHQLKEEVGNSCADSLLWGWSTVCNSISGGFYPNAMVYANGYLPVGGYTYNFTVDGYNKYPTYKIVQENGVDAILNAYTQVLPADALVSSTANHAMMVIGPARVYYNEDGSIDTAMSYIPIQDQRAGSGEGFYEVVEDGYLIQYSGRTSFDFTFADLIEKHYIPVTAAEFLGTDPYEKATASITNGNCKSIEDMQRSKISSNYPLAVARVVVTDKSGNETVIGRTLFSGAPLTGVPYSYSLSAMNCLKEFSTNELNVSGNRITLEVIVSTGDCFTLVDFTL